MKVYVIGQSKYYAGWLDGVKIIDSMKDADIILFTGGADVSSYLYGEQSNKRTFADSKRDEAERAIFEKYRYKFKLGICRGAQLLTALNGGKIIQHVRNHAINGLHQIKFKNGEDFHITSTHHQMMMPFNLKDNKYELIAWSSTKRSDVYENTSSLDQYQIEKEPEIVWYPDSKSMCIQGHPEMMESDSYAVICLNKMIKKYLHG